MKNYTKILKYLILTRPSVIISICVIIIFFITVYVKYGGQIILTDSSISLPTLAMVIFAIIFLAKNLKKIIYGDKEQKVYIIKESIKVILDWLPLPLLLFVYENLKGRIWIITSKDYTPWFASTDIWMFGYYPTVEMEKIYHPLLTEIMAFCYAMYFVMPFVITVFLYIKKRYRDFQISVLSMVICFYLGFVGYITFPCVIPKFFLKDVYTYPSIPSYFLHSTMDKLYAKANAAEIWGAFPSLHVGISTLGLLLAYHFKGLLKQRGLFWIFLPITVILWISTVYLRYHWIIDIYAGWILAIFSFYVSLFIYKKWESFVIYNLKIN